MTSKCDLDLQATDLGLGLVTLPTFLPGYFKIPQEKTTSALSGIMT
jgi:hypothetical protein